MATRSALRIALVASLLAVALFVSVPLAGAGVVPGTCSEDHRQPNGAEYRIWISTVWNGDLVVFAHGYVPNLDGLPEIPDE